MTSIKPCELPEAAFLRKYRPGGYADCYVTDLARSVSHTEYVEAFYTTTLFKLERRLLAWFVSRPSTDLQARELAAGGRESFAAWTVEARCTDQLLLCDLLGRTRSWLMCVPAAGGSSAGTRLYFGSAVVPVVRGGAGEARMGFGFHALMGFHRLYSRLLLRAAAAKLARMPDS